MDRNDRGDRPPSMPTGRSAIVILMLLVAIVALLLAFAFLKNPTGAPSPSSTAAPQTIPPG